LFGLVARCLPFDDNNLSCFIQKIIHEKPHDRLSMSAALSDLLHRIILSGMKTHPWFAGASTDNFAAAECFRLCFDLQNVVLDREIVGLMVNFGLDAVNLTSGDAAHMSDPTEHSCARKLPT
jgi:hypothetical protein